MQKKVHSLVLSVVFMAIVSIVIFSSDLFSPRSQAQTFDEFAYLPSVLKPSGPVPTPTSTTPPTPTTSPTIEPPSGMIYVDHNSVALFDQIPQQYLNAAANINMFYMDRSVGGNISYGLSCLHEPWESAPFPCKIYNHPAPEFSVDISEVSWDGTYDRSNWVYEYWPGGCGTWSQKVECFMNRANEVMNQYEVLSFQFSYLEVSQGSTVADLPGGFFYNNSNLFDVHDLATFEAQHPDKIFIYWTSSLARGIGSEEAESFNEQMRQYAITNNKILFDVADILSHTPDGTVCYDNRDGVPYNAPGQSENYPDDGMNINALCQHYTSEADGGHLGSPSAGMIRVAKAFWVLMAQIAGWNPN